MNRYDDLPRRVHEIQLKDTTSPRYLRALRFTHSVMAMMRDFLPSGRDFYHMTEDHLFLIGYEGNVEIINVPPECDELDKLKLELHRLKISGPKGRHVQEQVAERLVKSGFVRL